MKRRAWAEIVQVGAVLGWSPQQWEDLTLRELLLSHDAYLLDRWDHTAHTAAMLHNLSITVVGLASKSRPRPRPMTYFHPFRKHARSGLAITPGNIHVLKQVINSVVR